MNKPIDRRSAHRSMITVCIVFLAYYLTTALFLPYGAGPDYDAHFDGARFIFSEGRLAVLPQDIDKLHFTAYGSTRALRPPLPYLVAAGAAHLLSWTEIDLRTLFRAGSAFLCALTVGIAYLTLLRYFSSRAIALTGVLLIGLLPQFTFIASHLNDDSAAIFSVTLLLYCITRFLDRPVNPALALLTGLAIGLVLLSKFTAWLFLPAAGIAILAFARPVAGRWMPSLLTLAAGILIGGGWWIGFNIWHYGWSDPLLFKIGSQIATQFAKIDPHDVKGFATYGVSWIDLVFGNYRDFLNESLISAIGNLDWLRLRVGLPQYLLYSTVLFVAVTYGLARLLIAAASWLRGVGLTNPKRLAFEGLLVLTVLFQFLIYALYQWRQEIQVQGKYLLPVLMCVMLLFFSASARIGNSRIFKRYQPTLILGSGLTGKRIPVLATISVVTILAIHIDALRRFVIPYYNPPALVLGLHNLHPFDLGSRDTRLRTANIELVSSENSWHIRSLSSDSQIHLDPKWCNHFGRNNLIEIRLKSDGPGILQLFWSDGRGFVDRMGEWSTTAKFVAGENSLLLAAGIENCKALRLDPTNVAGQEMVIHSIAVAPLTIRRFPYYFRVFKTAAREE